MALLGNADRQTLQTLLPARRVVIEGHEYDLVTRASKIQRFGHAEDFSTSRCSECWMEESDAHRLFALCDCIVSAGPDPTENALASNRQLSERVG
jgi:hypothetical protein